MPAPDERQLILQAKEGSEGAFRLLVERHMKSAYDNAYHIVGNHDDAEDVAQEAFVRVHGSLGSFRGESGFSTWLYRIVMNLSLNKVRQKKARAKHEVRGEDLLKNLAHPVQSGNGQPDVTAHIERALHELPTLQRAVVIFRHLNGMTTREVSEILNCSEGTVKTHLHRGLKKMRLMLDYLGVERAYE